MIGRSRSSRVYPSGYRKDRAPARWSPAKIVLLRSGGGGVVTVAPSRFGSARGWPRRSGASGLRLVDSAPGAELVAGAGTEGAPVQVPAPRDRGGDPHVRRRAEPALPLDQLGGAVDPQEAGRPRID